MVRAIALATLVGALTVGCGSPKGEDTANLEDVDAVGAPTGEPPASLAGPGDPADTAPGSPAVRTPDGGEALTTTPDEDGDDTALPDWTRSAVSGGATATAPPVRVTAVRTGRHPDFDRVVIDLGGDGTGVPGYRVEYVDRPLHECGSGRQVQPVGQGWLQVRLEPAAAHTEAGGALLDSQPMDPEAGDIVRIYRTCDFEGVVELVVAVVRPQPFRAFHLDEPRRVVVDVRH